MAYLTEDTLLGYARSEQMSRVASLRVKKASVDAELTVFLSHSHHDAGMVKGLINYLASHGITVYVDWNDTAMPRVTGRTTAEIIKTRIVQNKAFMVLASANGLASRWVPWETGVADQVKSKEEIIVIPVADQGGKFTGNEYLQLYRRMEVAGNGTIAVFEPGHNMGGVITETVLRRCASR